MSGISRFYQVHGPGKFFPPHFWKVSAPTGAHPLQGLIKPGLLVLQITLFHNSVSPRSTRALLPRRPPLGDWRLYSAVAARAPTSGAKTPHWRPTIGAARQRHPGCYRLLVSEMERRILLLKKDFCALMCSIVYFHIKILVSSMVIFVML